MSSNQFGESIMNRNCTDVITRVFLADGSPPKELPFTMARMEQSSVSSSVVMERTPKMRMVNLKSERKSHDAFLDRSMEMHSHIRNS